jgi:ABC-type Fe3+-hydroxamate transport system substrate-binding protein
LRNFSFFDQLGNKVALSAAANRIVSLVPSQTELLYDLGLEEEVAGITKFCIRPPHWRKIKKIVGGTKNFDFDAIDALKPNLIIANKEENYKEGLTKLGRKYPVWVSDIVSLTNAFAMIRSIGEMTGKNEKALTLIDEIQSSFQQLIKKTPLRVLYLIWRNPWMAAGKDTFIHSMIDETGWINCVASSRYPSLTPEQIVDLNPDVILLSSEPYPFREKHAVEIKAICPQCQVLFVDGEMFSWYGSRLLKAPRYFNSLSIK